MAVTLKTTVELHVDGFVAREVTLISYQFLQAIDSTCMPTGNPCGGKINLTLKALNNDNGKDQILSWMLDKTLAKGGFIYCGDTSKNNEVKREIKFTGGYCVDYTLNWEDNKMETEKIVIACETITINNVPKFKNLREGDKKDKDDKAHPWNETVSIKWDLEDD